MNTRSTLGGGTLLGLALLFIGLTILFNHALRGWRLDLTQNRLYTTAAGTDRILASIKEPINLYFFFSAKTAAQLPQLKTYGVRVREFLEELAARSGGRLRLHVIDPQPFSEEEDRASELGVRGTAVGASGTQFYFGLAGTNSTDGHGAIEFFDPNKEQFLEYDVVKLVYQLANPTEVVADRAHALSATMRQGEPPVEHLGVLGLDKGSFTASDVITAGLSNVNLATAGYLEPVKDAKVHFEPLLQSSSDAQALPAARFRMLFDPATLRDGFKPTGRRYTIAARVSGNVHSAFPAGPPAGVTLP